VKARLSTSSLEQLEIAAGYHRGVSQPTDEDYRRLLEFRTGLRQFMRWSETQARAAGITPAHHQLLLAIRGHDDPRGPMIGDAARYLQLRHQSVVGLVDRAESAGLVKRTPDPDNYRAVRLRLTPLGEEKLEALSALALEELAHLAPTMRVLWRQLDRADEVVTVRRKHPAARAGSSKNSD
jgi:DNA-binding MarR family transcriptional regulator